MECTRILRVEHSGVYPLTLHPYLPDTESFCMFSCCYLRANVLYTFLIPFSMLHAVIVSWMYVFLGSQCWVAGSCSIWYYITLHDKSTQYICDYESNRTSSGYPSVTYYCTQEIQQIICASKGQFGAEVSIKLLGSAQYPAPHIHNLCYLLDIEDGVISSKLSVSYWTLANKKCTDNNAVFSIVFQPAFLLQFFGNK